MEKQTAGRNNLGKLAPKFAELNDEIEQTHGGAFGMGEPNTAFAKYFIGNSYLKPLNNPKEYNVFLANVTFEPSCRNNWIYTTGQMAEVKYLYV